MDSQNSQSVHTDESNRENNVSKAQILYPELCKDGCQDACIIAVEFGIDLSEAEAEKYAIWHNNYQCAETSYVEVNGCMAIHQCRKMLQQVAQEGSEFTSSPVRRYVSKQLEDWGFDDDQIDSFIKKIEVVKV